MRTVRTISGTNRNITFDNWYTSLEIINVLHDKHKLTAAGTLRKNKTPIPREFLEIKDRQARSSMFGFQRDNTLVSHVPRKGKNVILISSLHHDDAIDPSTGDKSLPEIINFYNLTRGGVDTVDEMSDTHYVARNCRRWPLRIFHSLVDTAGINSQIIYKWNTTDTYKMRRKYLQELGFALVKPTLEMRRNNICIPLETRKRILHILGETPQLPAMPIRSVGRCHICPRSRDRKTKYYFQPCNVYLYLEHMHRYC
ncbi:hypothetical protein JTB14_013448 [Gonioctena quinquepunctata]|nr:hypothetical protein JTB14_013448 [Gonioctena quinquepunctata]